MSPAAKQKVVIIGCGNVAWHLARHLQTLKQFELIVYNHQANSSLNKFKTSLKCKTVVGLGSVIEDADLYFICVSDRSIEETASRLKIKKTTALLMHTSGSVKLEVLGGRICTTAVFYPLQSFSKDKVVDWSKISIFIETADKQNEKNIFSLANKFSKQVYSTNYKQRLKIHLAAVLVNNFVNAMYVSASDLIASDDKKLDFKILLPLIGETTEKIKSLKPRLAQTGPAKRKDKAVMQKHLKLIEKDKELSKVYKQISELIAKQQKS